MNRTNEEFVEMWKSLTEPDVEIPEMNEFKFKCDDQIFAYFYSSN